MVKPVVAIFGFKDSGKTRFIEYVVKELTKRGWKVGVIKHVHHCDFQVDIEGKDTWRYLRSGAKAVSAVSDKRLYLNIALEAYPDIYRVIKLIAGEVDVVLMEGFSHILAADNRIKKIIVGENYPISRIEGEILYTLKSDDDYPRALEKLIRLITQ